MPGVDVATSPLSELDAYRLAEPALLAGGMVQYKGVVVVTSRKYLARYVFRGSVIPQVRAIRVQVTQHLDGAVEVQPVSRHEKRALIGDQVVRRKDHPI